jgi:hypothetical protein
VRDEPRPGPFGAGTLTWLQAGSDGPATRWRITLTDQPWREGRSTSVAQVVQNLPGVVELLLPEDRIESIRIYDGDGTEPLPDAAP